VTNTKFLGLGTEKYMEWNTDIEQIIPQLSTAVCYAPRLLCIILVIQTHLQRPTLLTAIQ